MIPPIVSAAHVLAAPDPRRVLVDVRWYLDGRSGRAAYEAGHIAGAVFADVDTDLSATDRPDTEGRHPLPSPAAFAAAMSRLGIGDDTVVVAYDDSGGLTAGRLVVMLRMLGCQAALLGGSVQHWPGAIEAGSGPAIRPARFTARPWPADRLATVEATVAHAAAGMPVLDARSAERYGGALTLVDKRPGHIPGAVSSPSASLVGARGELLDDDHLAAHFAALGLTEDRPAVVYCGSGVSACVNVLAMEHLGLPPARLYVASWSGYSADPLRPAALGH